MTWPLEPEGVAAFAEGLSDILVVEEKRSLIEDQLTRILYNRRDKPSVVGKQDEAGRTLLPGIGELNPTMIAEAILGRLLALRGPLPHLETRLKELRDSRTADTDRKRDGWGRRGAGDG